MQNKHKQIKDLPASHILKKVYIKSDQPKLTRKENDRLRQKAHDLREKNEGCDIKIDKGVLYKDNVKIDHFDLDNQIF